MQIDFAQAVTAETKAQAAAFARATSIKTDCRARILAVGSEATQMNIAQAGIVFTAAVLDGAPRTVALAASGLRDGDLTLAQGWKAWVAAMQTECRRAIESGEGPVWPDLPKGVADLAARF
ncbi:hypothetical protein KZZ08_04410 [Roseovarius mucosus]|uniref:hypothetical protein n=1 Tax=Roseovarius mucosus TaxID=215743 RepID=UPI001C5F555B|nr:hypothetical protein [Roseovarius mucosus]MBW4972844.1 hypothetical protein [Roseovarius mucosus]